ncbi:hypothetical protein D3C76_1527480 [compost metagenome]
MRDGIPITAQRDLQQRQDLFAVQSPGGVCATAMHQDAHAVGGQAFGCEQVPGQVALLAGVGWPVQVYSNRRSLHALT